MSKNINQFKKNTIKNSSTVTKSKKKKNNNKKKTGKSFTGFLKNERGHKVIGLFFILFSIYLLFAFTSYLVTWFSGQTDESFIYNISFNKIVYEYPNEIHNIMGKLGAVLSYLFIKEWFGLSSYFFILLFFISGIKLTFKINLLPLGKTFRYSFFSIIWFSITLGFAFYTSTNLSILGGIFGHESTKWLNGVIGEIGTGILLFFALLSFLTLAYNIPFKWIKLSNKKKENINVNPSEDKSSSFEKINPLDNNKKKYNNVEFSITEDDNVKYTKNNEDSELSEKRETDEYEKNKNDIELTIEDIKKEETITDINEREHKTIDTEYDPTLDLPQYKIPPLNLLNDYGNSNIKVREEELKNNKNSIVETLGNYSIGIHKIRATIGPTVTLYEIKPEPGVRISKIKNLEDDIALSLSALGIRIIAPMPGKGTIGIEVPNKNPEIVSIKSILSSERFQNSKFELPLGIGKTISNESYIVDLTKMPHILIAGATGQGKSVGLNAIITSLLYKKHPSQLKFVLVDPKKVELSLFSKIERHFLAKLPDTKEAIITDTRTVIRTLNSLNIEMDDRYDLLKNAQVRNIKEYNTKFINRRLNPNEGHRFLPYIVLVIDEFADLIMTAGKEIETPLTRLAQLSRAVGMHLIIATQRPSVNIITGTIKANFPARIAFRVISKIDSRTILDTGGADQLVGRGDMLLLTGSDLIRLQCAYVDIAEVEKITEFIGSQRAYPEAFNLPEYLDENSETNKEFDPSERDELFETAARIIVKFQHGSTSLLQRKLKLGYNRAGRIIDQLEAAGIVGPFEGSKAREVRIDNEIELEHFLKNLN